MRRSDRSIELRLGSSLLRASSMAWMLTIILGLPLLLLLVAVLIVAAGSGQSPHPGEALTTVWRSIDEDGSLDWPLMIAAVLLPVAVVVQLLQRNCYLKLTGIGIEGHLPWWSVLGFAGQTTGQWKVRWDAIRTVRLLAGKHTAKPVLALRGYRLVIETDQEQKRISPFPWILPHDPDHRLTLREMARSKRLDAAKVIERAPLVKELRARGIEFSSQATDSEEAPAGFDLGRHPGMIAQLVIFFAAGLYALLEIFFLQRFMALEPLPAAPFLIATIAGAAIAFASGGGAPVRERWVVGILMVAALTFAVYPGLLRFNATTAEPKTIPYLAVEAGRFESSIPGLPEIDLQKLDVPEYWSEYPEGSEHEFDMLRGAGGFWQVDLRSVYERTREFYSQ